MKSYLNSTNVEEEKLVFEKKFELQLKKANMLKRRDEIRNEFKESIAIKVMEAMI